MLPRAARLAVAHLRGAGLGAGQTSGYSTAAAGAAVAGLARRLAITGGIGGIGLGTYAVVTDESPKRFAFSAAMVPVRLGRDVVTAVAMVAGDGSAFCHLRKAKPIIDGSSNNHRASALLNHHT